MASFALPAWAVKAANIFVQYEPLSWVAAGFLGALVAVLVFLVGQIALSIRMRRKFNERLTEDELTANPLDNTFVNKRVFLNNFTLPTHPFMAHKTFIGCDIIGPMNILLRSFNSIENTQLPRLDVVLLKPGSNPYNIFILDNCKFIRCSFQRITVFLDHSEFNNFKHLANFNWVTPTPADDDEPELPLPAISHQDGEPSLLKHEGTESEKQQ